MMGRGATAVPRKKGSLLPPSEKTRAAGHSGAMAMASGEREVAREAAGETTGLGGSLGLPFHVKTWKGASSEEAGPAAIQKKLPEGSRSMLRKPRPLRLRRVGVPRVAGWGWLSPRPRAPIGFVRGMRRARPLTSGLRSPRRRDEPSRERESPSMLRPDSSLREALGASGLVPGAWTLLRRMGPHDSEACSAPSERIWERRVRLYSMDAGSGKAEAGGESGLMRMAKRASRSGSTRPLPRVRAEEAAKTS